MADTKNNEQQIFFKVIVKKTAEKESKQQLSQTLKLL